MSDLWIDGVLVDRLWADGVDVADGWLDGVYFNLVDQDGVTEPITPPVEPPSPPTIFQGIVMPDVSRQAFAPDYLDNLATYFVASANTDTVTYTATSTQSYVGVDVSAGLRVSFGYPGLTAGQATVTVTATATNAGGSASVTATFTVDVTLNNRVVIPVTNIRPPGLQQGTNGSYAFAGDDDLTLPADEVFDNPTWQRVIDIAGDYAYTQAAIFIRDADGADAFDRVTEVGSQGVAAAVGWNNISMTFRRTATQTLHWSRLAQGLTGTGQVGARWYTDVAPVAGSGVSRGSAIGDGRAYFIFDWN